MAQPTEYPSCTSSTGGIPSTRVGVMSRGSLGGLPSCPNSLRPQQKIDPPEMPHECPSPTVIFVKLSVTPKGGCTGRGEFAEFCVPVPSAPNQPLPQQNALPPLNAQVWSKPVATDWKTTPVMPAGCATTTGMLLFAL